MYIIIKKLGTRLKIIKRKKLFVLIEFLIIIGCIVILKYSYFFEYFQWFIHGKGEDAKFSLLLFSIIKKTNKRDDINKLSHL